MLISSKMFPYGVYFWRIWLTYTGCQMVCIWCKKCSFETALWLSLWVYNVDIKPGLIDKGVEPTTDILFSLYILSCVHPICCPPCNHGNSYVLRSTTGSQQCLNRLSCDHHHCRKHTLSWKCWCGVMLSEPPNDMSAANMQICCENVGPTTCRQHVADMSLTCHRHVADMSPTCRWHVGWYLWDIKKISCSQDISSTIFERKYKAMTRK